MIQEEGLRDWFGKSKSKDGKKGWVNVVTGDSCASDKPGEGIPKCVSSSKRASMSKKERVAAQAAKRREDPGQQSKSGASKPTNVKTDRKVRKEEMEVNEAKDKKGKGSGTKDACYHKVKSRYSVWPSAYASGALVKCRKVGAANWGNSTKEEVELQGTEELQQFMEKCWKGYEKKGMKTMFGKRYPNCVKKEEVEQIDELINPRINLPFSGDKITYGGGFGSTLGGAAAAGLGAAAAYGLSQLNKKKKKKEVKKEETETEEGDLQEFIKFTDAKARREALPKKDHTIWKPGFDAGLSKDVDVTKDPADAAGQVVKDKVVKPAGDFVKQKAGEALKSGGEAIKSGVKAAADYAVKNPGKAAAIGAGVVGAGLLAKKVLGGDKKKEQQEHSAWRSELNYVEEGEGKKDACYHKVKASAKVWPSAYASGRLVQCRKKGAANYGNSKKD